MPPPIDDIEDRLVIALDFGTTFSGIAYAFATGVKPEVHTITEWPGLEGYTQPKVPTTICYDPDDPSKFTWGGQEHKGDVIHGIKLLLDPDQKTPEYLPKSLGNEDLKRIGKKPVDVAADFISSMYEHALKIIESKYCSGYFKMCEKEFVLTVPAVWSDKAKDLTIQAAKKANIHPVTPIKEPEAAALFSLNSLKEQALKVGDSFVVCDAGGGTVDLISYEISCLSPQLELKEIVPSSGGMAGSLGLNRRFQQALNNLVGEDEFHRLRKTNGYKVAIEDFDKQHKPRFRGDVKTFTYINFPRAGLHDIPTKNLTSSCWEMQGQDMKDIFDPLVDDIVGMVEKHVLSISLKRLGENPPKKKSNANKSKNEDFVKAIVLVGGFGSSGYLRSCLEEANKGIQVIQPHDAWASIVKGAVLSRLEGEAKIVSTLSPRHYGVKANSVFQPGVDDGQEKWYDSAKDVFRCSKMTWFIKSGEELKRDQKVKHTFLRSIPKGYHPTQLLFTASLSQCESEDPPKYPTDEVGRNCKFTADLRHVDKKHLKKNLGFEKKWYYDVTYDLVITVQTAVMKFSLEIDGEEMGSVEANYD